MQVDNFYIESILVKNYKKFDDLSLDFTNQFTLIIGENGSGKTSVLDAVATLLGGYLHTFKDISSAQRHSITKRDIKLDIFDYDNNISVEYNTPVIISGMCKLDNQTVSIKRIRQNAGTTTATKLPADENRKLIDIIRLFEKDNNKVLPLVSYHGTGRLWEQDNKNSSSMEKLTRYDGYRDCLNAKSNYKNFIAWFKKQEMNTFNLRRVIPILEAVRVTVIQMLSIVTGKEVELFIYREGDLEIKYKNEDKREKFSNLSDGYRNIIGMVSDIAYRMAILNPNLGLEVTQKTSGVVLIDEIDLHLHPKWQKEIVNILTSLFPRVQFIATSHSPFIIQSIGKNSIIKLDQSNETLSVDATKLSIEDISENIQNIPTPQMSSKKIEMLEVAKEYFEKLELLEKGGISQEEIEEIKNRLDEVSAIYDDNMAYVAFLERKRLITESKL
ncbi:MAG: AAA family ATPase [Campylobacterales bacterium]|nr:AAA family ATPase [Campylobacterales bacterium]